MPAEQLILWLREQASGPMAMNPKHQDTCNMLAKCADAMSQLAEFRWISVADSLPEFGKWVLTATPYCGFDWAYRKDFGKHYAIRESAGIPTGWGWRDSHGIELNPMPTFWTNLPTNPPGDEEWRKE